MGVDASAGMLAELRRKAHGARSAGPRRADGHPRARAAAGFALVLVPYSLVTYMTTTRRSPAAGRRAGACSRRAAVS